MIVPDGSKSLSDGLVIETSLLARVIGMKLLTIEGTVVICPAEIRDARALADAPGAHRDASTAQIAHRTHPVASNGRAGAGLQSVEEVLRANAAAIDRFAVGAPDRAAAADSGA